MAENISTIDPYTLWSVGVTEVRLTSSLCDDAGHWEACRPCLTLGDDSGVVLDSEVIPYKDVICRLIESAIGYLDAS